MHGKRKTYIVEKVVGTGELLQRLEHHTQDNPEEHTRGSQELMPLLFLTDLDFVLFANLVHFFDDAVVILRDTVEFGQVRPASVDIALTVVITRTLGEEEHATAQRKGKEESETQGDTPLTGVFHGFGAQVDTVRQEDTQSDEELVAANNRTTDVTRGRFTCFVSFLFR